MDTASHLLLGVTLGGLALAISTPTLDSHSSAGYALLAATIIGSNAPDFDSFSRIRGYESYLKHHRGFSHSLPMLVGWPFVLAPVIAYLFNAWDDILMLFFWTMAGVILHVFLDLFNVYGVQCFRPISKKWFHGDAIPIFDPVIFGLHLTGLCLWMFNIFNSQLLFTLLFLLTFIFIIYRITIHQIMLNVVRKRYGMDGHSFLIPQSMPHKWGYIHETNLTYIAGSIVGRQIIEETVFQKGEQDDVINAAMGTDGVHSFLCFAHRVHITCQKLQDGYIVELRDIRFRKGEKLLFGIDVTLDQHLKVKSHSSGWKKKVWEPPFS